MTSAVQIFTSWPVPISAVLIVAIFALRRPLGAVMDRMRSLKVPGVEITAAKQDESIAKADAIVPSVTAAAAPQHLLNFNSLLVKRVADDLRKKVAAQFADNPSARETYLVEIAADAIAAVAFDYVYSLIYGSQLAAVRDLNSAGAVHVEKLKPYFEAAKANFPSLYETDTFERWLGWLTQIASLVAQDGEVVTITDIGRDFLQFVISRGYVFTKNG
jgi:hypothetical protein